MKNSYFGKGLVTAAVAAGIAVGGHHCSKEELGGQYVPVEQVQDLPEVEIVGIPGSTKFVRVSALEMLNGVEGLTRMDWNPLLHQTTDPYRKHDPKSKRYVFTAIDEPTGRKERYSVSSQMVLASDNAGRTKGTYTQLRESILTFTAISHTRLEVLDNETGEEKVVHRRN